MANVGSAYVTLMPSMKGFAQSIGSDFGGAGTKAGNAFGDGLSVGVEAGSSKAQGALSKLGSIASTVGKVAVAGFAALTGAVSSVGAAALSSYADYEQLVGGVDTLFKDASAQVQQYAADAYKTAGMSANTYMETVTGFSATLLQGLGGDTEQAARVADVAIQDMSDNANKMGTDIQMIRDAYQGFAKDNYDMLDNLKLGYGGTQAEMARLINDSGVLGDAMKVTAETVKDVPFDKMIEAIHQVQTEMGITGTTSLEAATTIQGSMSMAKAAWDNFLTGLGRDDVDFSALTTQLLDAIGTVATNVAPRVAIIGRNIIEAFPSVLNGLRTVLAPIVLEALAAAWNIAVQALAGLGIQLPALDGSQLMAGIQTVIGFVSDAVSTLREVLGAVGGIVSGALSSAWSAVQPFAAFIASSMLPALSSLATGAMTAFGTALPIVQQFGTMLQNLASAVMPVIANAVTLITPLLSQVVGIVGQLWTAISPLLAQLASVLIPAITTIGQALANLANAVLPVLASAAQIVLSVVQAAIPVISTIASVVTSVISVVVTVVANVVSVVVNAAATVIALIADVMAVVSAIVGTVSTVVGTIASVVGGFISTIVSVVSGMASTIVSTVGSLVNSALSFFSNLFSTAATGFQTMVSTLSNAAQMIYSAVTGAFSNLVSGVSSAIGSMIGFVSGIPGEVMGVFSGVGSWLADSGRALIDGFTGGIKQAFSGALNVVKDGLNAIRSFFPFSPAKKGPFSGSGYTTFSGKALMGDFAEGIEGQTGKVAAAARDALGAAQAGLSAQLAAAPIQLPSDSSSDRLAVAVERLHDDLMAIYGIIPEGMSRRDFNRRAREAVAYVR